jgi:uncharacterized membrane protein HdeD (DUF308 family)
MEVGMLTARSERMLGDPLRLQERAGWFIAIGIVFIVIGLIALYNVVDATLITTIILGFLLLIGAVFNFVGAFSAGGWGWGILRFVIGLLYVWAGYWLITEPKIGALTLTIVLAIIFVIAGIFRLIGAAMDSRGRWLNVFAGVVDILLGIVLWTGWPSSAIAIGIFVGLELLIAGFTWIMLGYTARAARVAAERGGIASMSPDHPAIATAAAAAPAAAPVGDSAPPAAPPPPPAASAPPPAAPTSPPDAPSPPSGDGGSGGSPGGGDASST